MAMLEREKGRFRDPFHRYFATYNPTDLDIWAVFRLTLQALTGLLWVYDV